MHALTDDTNAAMHIEQECDGRHRLVVHMDDGEILISEQTYPTFDEAVAAAREYYESRGLPFELVS